MDSVRCAKVLERLYGLSMNDRQLVIFGVLCTLAHEPQPSPERDALTQTWSVLAKRHPNFRELLEDILRTARAEMCN